MRDELKRLAERVSALRTMEMDDSFRREEIAAELRQLSARAADHIVDANKMVVPKGYRIEVQYAHEKWITTAYTLVAPDHRRWSPAPGEPGYCLLAALLAAAPQPEAKP